MLNEGRGTQRNPVPPYPFSEETVFAHGMVARIFFEALSF